MKNRTAILIFLVVLIGGILFSQAMGWWSTESEKVPRVLETGDYDPGDIRGSYTFGDVEIAFDIPAAVLAEVYGIVTEDPSSFALKSLEEIYTDLPAIFPDLEEVEIGTGSVRYFVSLATGIESPLAEPTYLPLAALEYLLDAQLIDQAAYDAAMPLALDLSLADAAEAPDAEETAEPIEEEDHVEPLVKGNTTVQEVLNAGVTPEQLKEILGDSAENRAALVKDLCVELELEFSTVKTQIQTLMEEAQ